MTKLKYVCSVCSKSFSRKWNAQRHNDTVHKDTALIRHSSNVRSFNNKSKIYSHSLVKSKFKTVGSKFNSNPADSPASLSSCQFKSFNNYYQNDSNKFIMSVDEEEKENILYAKLETMIIPFEKLEKLLVMAPYLVQSNGNIDSILSNIIIMALGRHDPVKIIQNYLSLYSRLYYRNKMILYVSHFLKIPVISTIEFMKSLLPENNI